MYLGALVVAPRQDVKRHFEFFVTDKDTSHLDESLRDALTDLFTMTPLTVREEPRKNDLVLDIVITHHQAGGLDLVQLDDIPIPVGWRPKVEVTARLSNVETNLPINTYEVTEKQPWLPYLEGQSPDIPDWRDIFSVPLFDSDILNELLYHACIKLLARVQKDVK